MLNRLFASLASRLAPDSRTKRDLVTTAFWHLQDVAYSRLHEKGFRPGGIIDVGAYFGEWTRDIRRIYPDAPVLMVEARESERAKLAHLRETMPDVDYVIALLGAERREGVEFSVAATGSSLFQERSDAPRSMCSLPMERLDDIVERHGRLRDPLFLKADVQGAEIEVLQGAPAVLSRAEVVQLEVALLQYNEGAPLAAQVIAFMDQAGFSMFDIAGVVRPNGQDLVQMDLLFVRHTSKLRPDYFTFTSRHS